MNSEIRSKGPELVNNGYSVCAIAKGRKGPMYINWQDRELTAQECEDWANGEDGVGIKCGIGENPICALDVDAEGDEDLANTMRDAITDLMGPELLIRIGKAPKFLVMYRAEQAGWLKRTSSVFEKNGRRVRLEALGKGQQFVAYHTHPETHKPYEWEHEVLGLSPLDVKASELPIIDERTVLLLIQRFEEEAVRLGYVRTQAPIRNGLTDEDLEALLMPPTEPVPGITIEEARKKIKEIGFDLGPGTNDTWVKLGMAIHHQFKGSLSGLALWDELSREFPEAYKEGETEKRWRSFHSNRPGSVTFRWVLSEWRKKVDPLTSELSVSGVVRRVLNARGDTIRYSANEANWFVYDERYGCWSKDSGARVQQLAAYVFEHELDAEADKLPEDHALGKAVRAYAFKQRVRLDSAVKSVTSALKSCESIQCRQSGFDTDSSIFCVGNGHLDLESGMLLPASSDRFCLRHSTVRYDPDATCPTWEKTVNQWLGGNDVMVKFVQRLWGSALSGNPREDKFVLLRGCGANGKSTFNNILRKVFGSYTEDVTEDTLFGRSGLGSAGRARADVVKLIGARLVVCSETDELSQLREADVKRMSGRDVIVARTPYAVDEIAFMPTWLLCVATNHLPEIKGDDDGIWRRVLDVEFPLNFERDPRFPKDIHLTEKLEKELPGILNWLLKGYQQYLAEGLQIPQFLLEKTKEYRNELDTVLCWLETYCEPSEGDCISLSDCYTSFVHMLKSRGESSIMTQTAFTRRLVKKVPTNGIRKQKGFRHLIDYRLKTADDFDDA